MNLVFISTDGVLSNQKYMELISKRGLHYMSNHQNQIDKNKLSLINYLVNKSNASVVLTGSWKQLYSLDKLNDMLRKAGATFKAIDSTPYLYKLEKGKFATVADEVIEYFNRLYLKDNNNNINFVILDDHLSNYETYNKHLVKVHYDHGVKPGHIEKAFDVLGIQHKK